MKAGSDKHSSSCGDCKPAQTFIAFSSGPRDCLGQRLAMMEVRQDFDLTNLTYQSIVKLLSS